MTWLDAKSLTYFVRRGVDLNQSTIMTDEFKGYARLHRIVEHRTVNHQREYVNGNIHTNSIEGFWALLKRGITGQYHKVSLTYLQKYVNEFAYRYNHRKNPYVFDLTILKAIGG